MANVRLSKKYHCFDDCRQSGCPEHEAILEFQSVSNAYHFINGKGKEHYFEQGELEAMIELLKQLQERRADSVKV